MTEFVENGTILFSGNFIENTTRPDRSGVFNWILLSMHRYSLFLKETNSVRQIIPFFFIHRPELAYGFQPYEDTRQVKRTKYDLFVKNGFQIMPVEKQTGFEKVKEHYDQYSDRVSISDRLKYINMPSKRVMDLLFRYPYGINSNVGTMFNYYITTQK